MSSSNSGEPLKEFDEFHTNEFKATPSTLVIYSERDLIERAKKFNFKFPITSRTILFQADSSESETNIGLWLQETENKEYYKEGGDDDDEDEEKDKVDWGTSNVQRTFSQHSGISGWEKLVTETPEYWDDAVRPGNNLLDYYALDLNEAEINGLLTQRVIATGQSCLGRCPDTQSYVYTRLTLVGKNLTDITLLQDHHFLQFIDLTWNQLRDISPLRNVPYLMHLNVAHNQLSSVLQFKPPLCLTYADFSFNDVDHLDNLSDFWSLKTLDLSHNYIKEIRGIKNLKYLLNLDLSYNLIKRLENMSYMHISKLNLEGNEISEVEDGTERGLSTLCNLRYLNLNNNKLKTLAFLKGVYSLQSLEMRKNKLNKLLEVDYMKSMRRLQELDFTDNPMTTWPYYRQITISILPSLNYLDAIHISVADKVSIKNRFHPDFNMLAAFNHTHLMLHEQLGNPTKIDLDIMPYDQPPYPLIVLVGPSGSGKSHIIKNISSILGDKIHIGVRHTTRPYPEDGSEVDGVNYHFVSAQHFSDLINNGLLLSMENFLGDSTGLSRMEVAKAVRKGCICVSHMMLPEAQSLVASGIRPCLLLTISESRSLHYTRLKIKYDTARYSRLSTGAFKVQKRMSHDGEANVLGGSSCSVVPVHEIPVRKKRSESFQMKSILTDHKSHSNASGDLYCGSDISPKSVNDEKQSKKPSNHDISKDEVTLSTYTSKEVTLSTNPSKDVTLSTNPSKDVTLSTNPSKKSLPRSVSFKDMDSPTNGKKSNEQVATPEPISVVATPESLSHAQVSKSTDVESSTPSNDTLTAVSTSSKDLSTLSSFYIYSPTSKLTLSSQINETTSQDSGLGENTWIRELLQSRESYIALHQENPGFFEAAFYTDDLKKVCSELAIFLKDYMCKPRKHPIYSPEKDPLYKEIVLGRVDRFTEMLNRQSSTMAQQRHDIFNDRTT